VRRPRDKSALLDALTASADGLFATYKDCLIFAASLGAFLKKRVPFDQTDEAINWQVFESYEPLVNLLAVSVSKDADIVDRERFGEQLTIFEELANAGLEQMAAELELCAGDQTKAMLNLMSRARLRKDAGPIENNVADIMSAFLKQ
jgi:dnd system-associated protein 4